MDTDNGDPSADEDGGLAAMVVHHRAALLRFLAARCGDRAEAENLLQDLWIKASAQSGGPIANGRAYLFRMASNLVLDQRRGRHRAMLRDRQWLEDDGMVEDRPDPAPLADDDLIRRQEADMLRTAIAALPPGARRALVLYRIEGHDQGAVAQMMGISRSGVEKHLALAMKQLKVALSNCGYGGGVTSTQQGHWDGKNPQPGRRP